MDALWRFIAWNLLPRRLIYWCYLRVQANATTGPYSGDSPGDVTWSTALTRWEPMSPCKEAKP